ncbi:MAG: hypothetical protein MOB07_19750 [Acidobacteria bacterium]|nr:hypothetical protein [Acidobacteriota bacterium]
MFTPRRIAKLILITTFFLGVAAGFSLSKILTDRISSSVIQRQKRIDKLSRAVNLDVKQREQVEVILGEVDQQYSKLQQLYQPQVAAIRETTRERIRSMLSPTQQKLYEQWIREMEARYRRNSSKSQQNR